MVPWVILVLFTAALTVADGYLFVPVSDGVHPDGELVPASLPTQVHTVLGGTLSFLMVFRTNTAYGKWWEARCSWSGVGGPRHIDALRDDGTIIKYVSNLSALASPGEADDALMAFQHRMCISAASPRMHVRYV